MEMNDPILESALIKQLELRVVVIRQDAFSAADCHWKHEEMALVN